MKFFQLIIFLILFSQYFFTTERTVLVISLDGVGYNFIQNKNLSSFQKLEANGIKGRLEPVFQSTTFPAHASMATGVFPDRHGIIHNIFFDTKKGEYNYSKEANWYDLPPIWILAEQQDIKTAVYYWIGSETSWNGTSATYKMTPFDNKVSEEKKINKIMEWLSLPDKNRPRLIMSWWHGIDNQAHKFGPESIEVFNQMNLQDKYLSSLLTKLELINAWDYLTLIVVSDHGMTQIKNFINLKDKLTKKRINAQIYEGPALANIFLDKKDIIKAKEVLSNDPLIQVFDKHDIPEELHQLHPTRSGDLIVTTEAPNMFLSGSRVKDFMVKIAGPKGMHGYHPRNQDMTGIFFAMGNGVRSDDNLLSLRQVDLAPTIANIIGIKIPYFPDGEVIKLH